MTLPPPWEDAPAPQVSALAHTLARLTQACWASGEPQTTTLSRGLIVTAYLVDDDLQLALSRADSEPGEEEAEIVAREAGWPHHEQTWRVGGSGRRGLVLTRGTRAPPPATPAPELPQGACEAIRALLVARHDRNRRVQDDLTQDDWDRARGSPFPHAAIVAQLARHVDPSYPPAMVEGVRAARAGYLKTLSVPELLEELDGYWSHWPARRAEWAPELENVMKASFP